MEPLVRSALSEWKGVLNRRWRDGSLLLQPVDSQEQTARWLKVRVPQKVVDEPGEGPYVVLVEEDGAGPLSTKFSLRAPSRSEHVLYGGIIVSFTSTKTGKKVTWRSISPPVAKVRLQHPAQHRRSARRPAFRRHQGRRLRPSHPSDREFRPRDRLTAASQSTACDARKSMTR